MILVASISNWLLTFSKVMAQNLLIRSVPLLTAFLIAACAPVQLPEGTLVTGVKFPGGSFYTTTFFNYDATRLCYMYEVSGDWRPAGEQGLLRSSDGRELAGVLLWSESDLAHFEGPDLISRAAKRITQEYEKRQGRPLTDVQLIPFESIIRVGAMKWLASWPGEYAGKAALLKASKVLVEIAPAWIAQITVAGTQDDDRLAKKILEALDTSSDPNCYRELKQKLHAVTSGK
jgi:hypothetical protein